MGTGSGATGDARAIIFDLDGTLVDSVGVIAECVNGALADAGEGAGGTAGYPAEQYRRWVGYGLRALAVMAANGDLRDVTAERGARANGGVIPAARFPQWYKELTERYEEAVRAPQPPYPGVRELLAGLRDAGYKLGVLSNKPHRLTTAVVERTFPGGIFGAVRGLVDGEPGKPDPSGLKVVAGALGVGCGDVILVGDSEIDCMTGVAGKVRLVIGVNWGYGGGGASLREAGAGGVIGEPGELWGVIGERGG